jgi:plasmid stability protein
MKTTVELPDSLVKQIKLRAVREGRKLKDAVAELLSRGLAADAGTQRRTAAATIRDNPKTGLPVIQCAHPAKVGSEITPDRAADILLNQEAS